MNVPKELRYSKTHEWTKHEAGEVMVGITAYAQEQLRDVVFVEVPKVGRVVAQGEAIAAIESVKAAFDIYAPISGMVSRVNDALAKGPQLVNQDCYGEGWIVALSPREPSELTGLMSAEEYIRRIQQEVA